MRTGLPPASEIVTYPEAGHGFFSDYRPSYAASAAADGWERTLSWLAAHLDAPKQGDNHGL